MPLSAAGIGSWEGTLQYVSCRSTHPLWGARQPFCWDANNFHDYEVLKNNAQGDVIWICWPGATLALLTEAALPTHTSFPGQLGKGKAQREVCKGNNFYLCWCLRETMKLLHQHLSEMEARNIPKGDVRKRLHMWCPTSLELWQDWRLLTTRCCLFLSKSLQCFGLCKILGQ